MARAEIAPAGLLRRLGAVLYDALLLIALLIIATFPFIPLLDGRVIVPEEVGVFAYVYWLWELVLVVAFFGFFWTKRGQTIGMLAWRLRVERADGGGLRWSDVLRRLGGAAALFVPALAGYQLVWGEWSNETARLVATLASLTPVVASWLWIYIDRDRRTWHDRWSGTRVVVLPKKV